MKPVWQGFTSVQRACSGCSLSGPSVFSLRYIGIEIIIIVTSWTITVVSSACFDWSDPEHREHSEHTVSGTGCSDAQ